MTDNHNTRILPIIVIAQFACTSLWFAGNAVLPDLLTAVGLTSKAVGNITSAVQFGFITGTLVFAILTISDRYSPSKVFFVCAMLGALSNLGILIVHEIFWIGTSRFVTGFFLAGIYPVGMKIAADYFDKKLGKALGFLVGALVLGTAFPHLVKSFTEGFSWKYVIAATSILSVLGGCLILFFVLDGPHRTVSAKQDFNAFYRNFKNKQFRAAALGYFGHMWELYTFWAFLPILLTQYANNNFSASLNISLLTFIIIASGFISCIIGGFIAQKYSSAKTAFGALLLSFMCCLLSPLLSQMHVVLFVFILVVWGMAVVADSPQFSTLVAQAADPESKGTALTIVNCIGFSITIVSIQLISMLSLHISTKYLFLFLSVGPLLGLFAMRKLITGSSKIQSL